jgi:hypothetical protein
VEHGGRGAGAGNGDYCTGICHSRPWGSPLAVANGPCRRRPRVTAGGGSETARPERVRPHGNQPARPECGSGRCHGSDHRADRRSRRATKSDLRTARGNGPGHGRSATSSSRLEQVQKPSPHQRSGNEHGRPWPAGGDASSATARSWPARHRARWQSLRSACTVLSSITPSSSARPPSSAPRRLGDRVNQRSSRSRSRPGTALVSASSWSVRPGRGRFGNDVVVGGWEAKSRRLSQRSGLGHRRPARPPPLAHSFGSASRVAPLERARHVPPCPVRPARDDPHIARWFRPVRFGPDPGEHGASCLAGGRRTADAVLAEPRPRARPGALAAALGDHARRRLQRPRGGLPGAASPPPAAATTTAGCAAGVHAAERSSPQACRTAR